MAEFTPTTGQVRDNFAWAVGPRIKAGRVVFDRWLAAHDAEVWEQGFNAGELSEGGYRDEDDWDI